MSKIIVAFGDNPNLLGGFREHNPFRLWVRERFSKLLQEAPNASIFCPMFLGPGQWCAEVCIEKNVPFVAGLVPGSDRRWLNHQLLHYAKLIRSAIGSWDAEAEYLPPALFHADSPPIHWFAAVADPEKLTGSPSKLIRHGRNRAEDTVEVMEPSALPPPYQALGILEELRETINPKLKDHVRNAGAKLLALVRSETLSPTQSERAMERVTQLLDLYSLLEKIETR